MTALFIGGYFYRIDNPWYGSSVCFPLGILYTQHEKEWNKMLCRHYFIKNVALLSVCGICFIFFFLLVNDSVIGNPIARNLAAVSFCLCVISISQKITVEHWLLQWLGKISYEIFLIHPLWISIIGKYTTEPCSYIMLVITLTIVSSALLHAPIAKIQRKLLQYFIK